MEDEILDRLDELEFFHHRVKELIESYLTDTSPDDTSRLISGLLALD